MKFPFGYIAKARRKGAVFTYRELGKGGDGEAPEMSWGGYPGKWVVILGDIEREHPELNVACFSALRDLAKRKRIERNQRRWLTEAQR